MVRRLLPLRARVVRGLVLLLARVSAPNWAPVLR
jgi:hypothetical protein